MKNFLLLIVFIITAACGGLTQDSSKISALNAGYPTVEFLACGTRSVGLAICTIAQDQDMSELDIKVQGYYEGEVRIFSSGCPVEIDQSLTYKKNELIKVNLEGAPNTDCVVGVTLSPRYKNPGRATIDPLNGFVYIRRTSRDYVLKTDITIQDKTFQIPMNEPSRVVALSTSCNVDFDFTLIPLQGFAPLRLTDLMLIPQGKKICIINGAVVESSKLLVWYVAFYDRAFVPLPKPSLQIKGDKLKVQADDNVAVISLDASYEFDSKASFKFDQSKSHVLRVLTTRGRSSVAVWEGGKWRWL